MESPTLVSFNAQDGPAQHAIAQLPGTVEYGLRKFPRPDAYRGLVSELADTDSQERLAAIAQRDWHVRGQTGCQFARLAALQAADLSWRYAVAPMDEHSLTPRSAGIIEGMVAEATTDPTTEVLSILLPGIEKPLQAVNSIRALVESGAFWLERDELTEQYLHLHLRYPINQDGVPAWIMAFAPFDFMPNTRIAPFMELAVRVKPKPAKIFHRLNQDPSVAHLADLPLQMQDKYWEDRFDSTLRRTRMVLGEEPDEISAAKATLTVPRSVLADS